VRERGEGEIAGDVRVEKEKKHVGTEGGTRK
jgi:hypothetical protein